MKGLIRHLTLPGTIAHELSHALVGAVWAERVAIEIRPRSGAAKARIDWRDDAPDIALFCTGIAPFVAGLLALTLGVTRWLGAGTPVPDTPWGWLGWAVVAMWWVVFVAPSPQDLGQARAALEGEGS